MNLVPVRTEHVDQLLAIYRAAVARPPHCRFTPDATQFRDDLLNLAPRLRSEQQFQVLVAEASGVAQGFASLTTYEDEDEGDGHAQAITGLFAATEEAARALIEACEARATNDEILAFPPTHGNTIIQTYDAGWDGLSSFVPGVARAFAQHGYAPFHRELHMIAPLDPAGYWSSPLAPSMTQDGPKQSSSYPWSRVVRAMDGETRIGLCNYSTLAPVTDVQGAERVGYIWGLGVNDEYRRRGIARALVTAAMKDLADHGCTECWLTTAAANWSAQSLYYSLGFEVVDCSVSFRKRLRS